MRELAAVFRALSDETRLQMLGLLLREGELCVCDFVEVLSVTQSKASRHLRYLRAAGLLEDERDGLIMNYREPESPDPELAAVHALLRELLGAYALPDVRPQLVQLRAARAEGRAPAAGGVA